jgi:predicted membrane GTPase involved in stress response
MESKQKKTKSGQVKSHLFEKGKIDSWTAIELYGATRLSAIIFNLRKRGFEIISQPTTVKDRNGNLCNFAVYVLINK